MHIGVVYYYISDMNRSLAFYRDKLGLDCKRVEFDLPYPWAELDTGGRVLKAKGFLFSLTFRILEK